MESKAVPEEKEGQEDNGAADIAHWHRTEMDIDDILDTQTSLDGAASKDPLMTLAMACAVGDEHARNVAKQMWDKNRRKAEANLLEMQKRQETGTENIRADRGKRAIENECS